MKIMKNESISSEQDSVLNKFISSKELSLCHKLKFISSKELSLCHKLKFISLKELSLCHKIKFSNLYIFATQSSEQDSILGYFKL